jgi:hypothetical protein
MRKHRKVSTKTPQVTITLDALIHRINRRLRHDDERLRIYRGGRSWTDLGDYYVTDTQHGGLVEGHVDPEQLGRKLGSLKPHEKVEVA